MNLNVVISTKGKSETSSYLPTQGRLMRCILEFNCELYIGVIMACNQFISTQLRSYTCIYIDTYILELIFDVNCLILNGV